jgi:hypothetical protein
MRAVNLLKLGVGIVAALMLSIATTASASAALLFLASKIETLLAQDVSRQIFTTDAAEFECRTANILAGTTALKSEAQLALVDYEECGAEFTPWDLLFLANGEADLLKLAKFAFGCEISWPAQKLNKYDYKTNGNNLLIESLLTGIKYLQNALCPGGSGHFANGTLRGHWEMMIANGTVSFDP